MTADRRKEVRHRLRPGSGLRLIPRSGELEGRVVMAQLVDASEGGLGVESMVGFQPGLLLEVSADMVSSDLALRVAGVTRVAYSNEIEPGRFRVGLELIDITLERVA